MQAASIEYERLVAELHQSLIRADGVTTVSVMHDTTLTGKSGAKHQIDVYWEFTLGGVLYRTCIECKQFTSRIKKLHVAAFAAVIDDIGGATGIFATTIGFQKGAKLLAKHKNIRLVLVNPLIREVVIKYHFQVPQITVTSVEFDMDSARARAKEAGIVEYNDQLQLTDRDPVFDEAGVQVQTLGQLVRSGGTNDGEHVVTPDNLHLKTVIGLIRIKSIFYSVKNHHIDAEDRILGDDMAKAILEDVIENTACYLNIDGTISSVKT